MLTGEAFIISPLGDIDYENPLKLNFNLAQRNGAGENFGVEIKTQMVLNDCLYVILSIYGETGEESFLYSFNLITGEQKAFEQKGIRRLLPYEEGQLLAIIDSKPYEDYRQAPQQVMVFNPEADSLAPFIELPEDKFGGFAYSLHEKALYYSAKGQIYRQQEKSQAEQVAYIGGSNFLSSHKAWITNEKLYIISSDQHGLIIKNADVQYKGARPLVLDRPSYLNTEVNDGFRQKYPDVPLVFSGEDGSGYSLARDMAMAIQTGESNIDIFSVDAESFKKLMEKDYAAQIESETVLQKTQRMRPFIKDVFTKDGIVYAVPDYIYMDPTNSYSPRLFKEVGLTQEDLPKTYMDYLNFIKRWYDELAQENPDYSLFSVPTSKDEMVGDIVRAYGNLYEKKGVPIDYDTALFRKLMAKADEVFDSLDLGFVQAYSERPLFESYGDNILGGATQSYKPFLLSLDEGVPPAKEAHMNLLFINPLSQNKQAATAYLEEVMNAYQPQDYILYYADEEEPIVNEDYHQWITGWEDEVAQTKEKVESLEGIERKEAENIIWLGEGFIENREAYYWIISPQDIDYFNTIADAFFIPQRSLGGGEDESINMYNLLESYQSGALTLDEFIIEANRRQQMAEMENQ